MGSVAIAAGIGSGGKRCASAAEGKVAFMMIVYIIIDNAKIGLILNM